MSSEGPGLFSDFGKKAKEILTTGYSSHQKFTVDSRSHDGVAIVSVLEKKGSLSTGYVSAKYNFKNTGIDVKIDTDSNILTELTFDDILPSTKAIASCRLPDYKSGKFEAQYFHEHARFTMAMGLNKSPAVDVSATIGTPHIAFGTEASYAFAFRNFTKYNAGVSLTKPNFSVSVILAEKGDALRAIYLHHLDQKKRGTVVGEMEIKFSANESTLTVGCSYAVDAHTTMKAKLNNHGKLGALVKHELKPKSFLTVSGSFDTKAMDQIPKFGVSLALVP
ncbi:PREDICTED: mitochondrial outer membrane protein porin 2-like [Ipomoea nil]|uniref:mitochondrial outer membrane protein porin 2-like n=1 Tax=Ipomoea nil TaxID=35883 RepID=UPI0009012DCE|nr:PREDICTED: mitochondrial outer membrane protein porin 2-like [Ipomoea nil]